MLSAVKSAALSRILKLSYENVCLHSRNMSTRNIKFDTKHLAKGDPLPPYNGKLRVYNMRYCPYAQRLILALNAKNIDYEIVNVNLVDKPDWLFQKSSFGKVPSLEIREDLSIYESLVTVEYIDDVYPERPLLPKDPELRAYDKIIIEATAPIHTLFFYLVKFPERVTEETLTNYQKALGFVQEQLQKRGTTFLDGTQPGFADYMIWPWFERLLVFKDVDDRVAIDPVKYKLLVEYLHNMLKDPVVTQYLVPKDIMLEFIDSYKNNQPKYNIVLEQ